MVRVWLKSSPPTIGMVSRFGPIVSPSFQSPKLVVLPQVVLSLEQNSTDGSPHPLHNPRQIQTSNLSRLNRDLISRESNFKLWGTNFREQAEFRRYTRGVELSINFKRSLSLLPHYPSISVTRRERGSVRWPNLRLLVNDTRWQQFTVCEYFARAN